MKSAIVACLLVCAYASSDDVDPILKNTYDSSPDGGFQFAYETGNGISGQADGKIKYAGKDEAILEIQGSSQYKSPEGEIIQLSYVANELGYQPQGAHLPTPPPTQEIPAYIARSLEYIAAHPYQEKKP